MGQPTHEAGIESLGQDPQVAPVNVQEHVRHRASGLGKVVIDRQPHGLEDDLPRQRVSTRMDTARSKTDQDVSGTDTGAIQDPVALDDAHDESS